MNGNNQKIVAAAEALTCDQCGERSVSIAMERERFLYGAGSEQVQLEADVPVMTCSSCGEQFTGADAEAARHEAVCHHLGRLTPQQLRNIREKYGLTQDQFAELTGFGSASIKRWETGALIQNASADRFLRLVQHPDNFWRLKGEFATQTPTLPERKFRTEITDTTRRKAKLFELCPSTDPTQKIAA